MKSEDAELIKKAMLDYKLRVSGNFTDDLKNIECDENFIENLRKAINDQEERGKAQKRREEDKLILKQKTKEFLSALGINFLVSCSCAGENVLTVRGTDLYEIFNNEMKLKELLTKLKLKMFW